MPDKETIQKARDLEVLARRVGDSVATLAGKLVPDFWTGEKCFSIERTGPKVDMGLDTSGMAPFDQNLYFTSKYLASTQDILDGLSKELK